MMAVNGTAETFATDFITGPESNSNVSQFNNNTGPRLLEVRLWLYYYVGRASLNQNISRRCELQQIINRYLVVH